jgi:hypothetical protein
VVYLMLGGSLNRSYDLVNDSSAAISGAQPDDQAGTSMAAAGDVDGDGSADILIGAPGHDNDLGAVYLLRGPQIGSIDLEDEGDADIFGAAASDHLGTAVAGPGDWDGDGWADLLLGAPGAGSGAVYLLFGGATP